MKNPHGVAPTRYKKKQESKEAIGCLSNYGPSFGNNYGDINIADNCTKESSCWICDPSKLQYYPHEEYKSSLYVNTDGPNYSNRFSVLDYEVYTHN